MKKKGKLEFIGSYIGYGNIGSGVSSSKIWQIFIVGKFRYFLKWNQAEPFFVLECFYGLKTAKFDDESPNFLIFQLLPFLHFKTYNIFLWTCSFLAKILSNFVSLSLKLRHRYYHDNIGYPKVPFVSWVSSLYVLQFTIHTYIMYILRTKKI